MSDINSYNAGLVAAYVPTVWNTGDVITANKLNNMENGIEATNLITPTGEIDSFQDPHTFTCEYTPQQLFEMYFTGKLSDCIEAMDGTYKEFFRLSQVAYVYEDEVPSGVIFMRYTQIIPTITPEHAIDEFSAKEIYVMSEGYTLGYTT